MPGGLGVRLHPGEQRWRAGEVHHRFRRRPEGATAGEQGAHDHGDPVEGTGIGTLVDAAEPDAPALAEADEQAHGKGRQHQDLPVQAEEFRRPGEQRVDQQRHTLDVDQRGDQEGAEEAATD
ncbi:hypothetical protein D3C76_1063980 [compost metagenome]